MKRAGKSPLCLKITNTSKLVIQGTEFVPLVSACDPDESGEVEACVVAYILIVCLHRRVNEKVCDALVDRCAVLEGGNKWSNVLEGCASYNLRARIQEETIV